MSQPQATATDHEQLMDKILTPAQRAQAQCRRVENLPYMEKA